MITMFNHVHHVISRMGLLLCVPPRKKRSFSRSVRIMMETTATRMPGFSDKTLRRSRCFGSGPGPRVRVPHLGSDALAGSDAQVAGSSSWAWLPEGSVRRRGTDPNRLVWGCREVAGGADGSKRQGLGCLRVLEKRTLKR